MDYVAIVAVTTVVSGGVGVIIGRMSTWSIISERDDIIYNLQERIERLKVQIKAQVKRGPNGRFVKRNKGEAI